MTMVRILYAVAMSFRWWLVVAALVLGATLVARADQKTEQQIRSALDANFEAYNNEDVEAMMKTLSPTLPGRNEFARQSAILFKTNDAYISVREFELLQVKGQWAMARVVQGTTSRDGAPAASPDEVSYREKSQLLPSVEESEYLQAFKRENGKWRLWMVMSAPKPVVGKRPPVESSGQRQCPNGNCGFPRIRVKVQ